MSVLVRFWHDLAVENAQLALEARHKGRHGLAKTFSLTACHYEIAAADRLPCEPRSEPTRSILYRSAASLAYWARDFELSRQLIIDGRKGTPPAEIEAEYQDLLDVMERECSSPDCGNRDPRFGANPQDRSASTYDHNVKG